MIVDAQPARVLPSNTITSIFIMFMAVCEQCALVVSVAVCIHAWVWVENDNARTSNELAATQDPAIRIPIFCHAFLLK